MLPLQHRLQASLLSIKMFWAPELERERRTRMAEKTRAERAERVLKEQLEKGVRYMQKLVHLEAAYVHSAHSTTCAHTLSSSTPALASLWSSTALTQLN